LFKKALFIFRMHSMKKDSDLFYLLYGNQNIDRAQKERSRYWQYNRADAMARKIDENPNEIEQLIVGLIDQADLIHTDLVLACLCAWSAQKIRAFASKLST
jgi:hypothetical protein